MFQVLFLVRFLITAMLAMLWMIMDVLQTLIVDLIEPTILVLNSAAVTSNFNGMQTSCDGSSDGEITILASGGTPNYNYSVTG